MNVFWALVKNDLGIAKHRKKYDSKGLMLGLELILLFGGIFFAYSLFLIYTNTTPEFFMRIQYILIWVYLPVTIGIISKEWKGNTVGWWLTLPYSRKTLIGAKLLGGFLRFFRDSLIIIAIFMIYWLEGVILRPSIWGHYNFANVMLKTGEIYLAILFISPLLIILGMLIYILRNSRLRIAVPLIIVIYVWAFLSLINILAITPNKPGSIFINYAIPGLSLGMTHLLEIIIIWALSYLLFLFTSYVLEKYVEI